MSVLSSIGNTRVSDVIVSVANGARAFASSWGGATAVDFWVSKCANALPTSPVFYTPDLLVPALRVAPGFFWAGLRASYPDSAALAMTERAAAGSIACGCGAVMMAHLSKRYYGVAAQMALQTAFFGWVAAASVPIPD